MMVALRNVADTGADVLLHAEVGFVENGVSQLAVREKHKNTL